MIYILYGQPGSGKTSLGKLLANHLDTPFIIDGDEFRGMFSNLNYGKEGREENIRNANAVATYLNKKGKTGEWKAIYINVADGWKSHPVNKETDVVVSLVSPYESLRRELKENNKGETTSILLTCSRNLRKEYHVEDFEMGDPDYIINTDGEVNETWDYIKTVLKL